MKKFLAIILLVAMLPSLLAGCGTKEANLEVDKEKVLKVWSFTDELKKPLEYFEEHYGIKTELTIIPTADYPTKVQPVLEAGVEAPDVFTAEIAWLKQWTDLPYWDNLSEKPYDVDGWAKDYVPYVWDLGKDTDGNVKALSWQATPGGFIYKRAIARDVWGNDDPEFVGKKLDNFESFFQASEELKQAGYRILPNEESFRWFAKGKDPKPWVNDKGELVFTDSTKEILDYQKILREKDYTAMAPEWSSAWFASMSGPIPYNAGWEEATEATGNKVEVFGYVMPTWGLHFVMKPNAGESAGDWGLTAGPTPYFWGGTWLGVYSKSENKGAAWEFVKMMTHDEEFLTWWYNETGDLLSYKPVTDKVKDSASDEFLKGQNHYDFFLEEANNIAPGIVTGYDQQIDAIFGDLRAQFLDGSITKDEMVKEFYKQVKNAFPEITTP